MAPRQRSKFGAPLCEPEVFRKQMYCIEESSLLVSLLELFGAPIVIHRPGIAPLFPPRYAPKDRFNEVITFEIFAARQLVSLAERRVANRLKNCL